MTGVIGGTMKFALLTGDETPDDLRELVANLREKQRRCRIASVRDELDADINEALDLLSAREQPDWANFVGSRAAGTATPRP